jgi:hypothetical protein
MYKASLHLDSSVYEQTFQVLSDPRIKATAADYEKQSGLLQNIAADVNEIHVSVVRMRNMKKQLTGIIDRIENKDTYKSIVALAGSINAKIDEWEAKLIQTKSESNDDVINFVNKLTANYIFLRGELDTNTPHVTSGHVQRFMELNKEWLMYKAELNAILENDIKNFNEKCKALQLAHASLID